MELKEAISIAQITEEEAKCNPKELDATKWKAVIDGIKGAEGDAGTLLNNMKAARCPPPDYPNRESGLADLFECGPTTFPCQTHHLIPEKQLPDLPVTAWLTDSPKSACKHKKYVLKADTSYDTNGAANGYYLPFASTTYQWNAKPALRNRVCFEMMRRTKLQLHQGRHSSTKDYGEDITAEEFSPYKEQVDTFLKEIERQVATHVKYCTEGCKADGEEEVQPLAATVAMVEQASWLLKVLLQRGKIVVSARAGAYRNRYAPKGKGYKHPTEPFLKAQDFQ